MQCPACNVEQADDAKFCNQCGSKLPLPVSQVMAGPDGRCEACGFLNTLGSRFCSECGTALTPVGTPPAALMPTLPPLRLISSRGTPIHFPASSTSTWIIGREDPVNDIHPDVDLTPYDPESTVSRRHAQLTHAGGQYLLTSVATTNWTALNGIRLKPQDTVRLRAGDRIEFGRCVVTFDTNGTFGN